MSKPGRPDEDGHENHERWLITYADMITLLMAFFIMMYSMSVVDLRKFEALSAAARHVFGGGAGGRQPARAAGPGLLEGGEALLPGAGDLSRNHASLVSELTGALDRWLPDRLRAQVEVTHSAGLVRISMRADTIMFRIGEAELTDEARRIVYVLGPSLRRSGAPLLVEGHTCDLPINTARYPSNWELSAQRAVNVMVHLIRRCAIHPDRICAVGYADTRPIAPNDAEAGRMRNRRVDIVVLCEDGPARGTGDDGGVGGRSGVNESVRLRPVCLVPAVNLPARHYRRTGRRDVDTPAGD